ncbi:hypothetical protein EVAR_55962_1 [Eumeta japonica]|uniref:Uncharacterized protein n=1 Tax=Eumeta variegata TaxID=151549 RepID=A0A4C1YVB9_EUMVA|nr:hypothetical protein EVAR_55962_1 [Eumeta japonica]
MSVSGNEENEEWKIDGTKKLDSSFWLKGARIPAGSTLPSLLIQTRTSTPPIFTLPSVYRDLSLSVIATGSGLSDDDDDDIKPLHQCIVLA